MRWWLLTSTTYGTWLPGDVRGSVTSVRDYRPSDGTTDTRVEHDQVGDAWEAELPQLRSSAVRLMKAEQVRLTADQAVSVVESFCTTVEFRGWRLLAVAVMNNHFHAVVGTPTDVDPTKLLGVFKAYASRPLNERFRKPASGTWWTKSGSTRKLSDDSAVDAAVAYVLWKQDFPLVTWSPSEP
jgi:REP element-mobilizing transposase RayT